jgi:hypothetical protein
MLIKRNLSESVTEIGGDEVEEVLSDIHAKIQLGARNFTVITRWKSYNQQQNPTFENTYNLNLYK